MGHGSRPGMLGVLGDDAIVWRARPGRARGRVRAGGQWEAISAGGVHSRAGFGAALARVPSVLSSHASFAAACAVPFWPFRMFTSAHPSTPRSRRRAWGVGVVAVALGGGASCARFGYDTVAGGEAGGGHGGLASLATGAAGWPPDASHGEAARGGRAGDPEPAGGASGEGGKLAATGGAGAGSIAGTGAVSDAGASGGGAASGEGGAGSAAGAAGTGGADTTAACVLVGNESVVNGFDTGTNGATAVGAGNPTVAWNADDGNPNPGCLEYGNTTGALGELRYDGPLGDLSGRFISMNVRASMGTGVRMRLFLEAGPQRLRATGPYLDPIGVDWSCLPFDVQLPAATQPGFTPTDIVAIGVELDASSAILAQLDQIAY